MTAPRYGNRHKNSFAEFLILRYEEGWLICGLITAVALVLIATGEI